MKADINVTLNKLLEYAFDNLMLDALDETYTLNRLAALLKTDAVPRIVGTDYGNASLDKLLDELAVFAPGVDKAAVASLLFPMPRVVNMYFGDALRRSADKAFEFLYDLYGYGYNAVSKSEACGKDGFLAYHGDSQPLGGVMLEVGGDELVYIPRVVGNRIAAVENNDTNIENTVAREVAFAVEYKSAIATRIGAHTDYCCCKSFALTKAGVKETLSSGAVKVVLLDYPVPVLAFNGIAKNSVVREATRVIKAATSAGYDCVAAAAADNGITVYIVFAGEIPSDGANILIANDALGACGVFRTIDCTPLMSVLEKGTALSTDLAAFKPLYDVVGGVKLGAKASAALSGALVDMFKTALAASATATAEQVKELVKPE